MYTRVVQYGEYTEVYNYEKNLGNIKRRSLSSIQKKRAAERRKKATRSSYSIRRSLASFFRLCHHNTCLADSATFLTLTFPYDISQKLASRHVSTFIKRIEKAQSPVPVSYISVPETTKIGRIHFHLLVFNLSSKFTKAGSIYKRFNIERETRNLQRMFRQGYVDICPISSVTTGVAAYMAKYMAKSMRVGDNANRRYYNCSRNIAKVGRFAGNEMPPEYFIVGDNVVEKASEYDTMWLGRCNYQRYKNIKTNE